MCTEGDDAAAVVGYHGGYHWLSGASQDISVVLRACPDVVIGKYLAVTSIDSGGLNLTADEKSRGWWTARDARVFTEISLSGRRYSNAAVAYSPLLSSIHGLPNETHDECCAGFDEWYVFDHAPVAAEMEVYVNWGGFRLGDGAFRQWIDRFWEQMVRIGAESYIANGTDFNFATRNREIFDCLNASFSTQSQ